MDGTRAETSDDKPAAPARPSSNSPYERYKQQLHAFFNGDKPLPDHLKDMLATRPGAGDHGFAEEEAAAAAAAAAAQPKKKAEKKEEPRRRVVAATTDDIVLADAIRKSTSPKEAQVAVDALLARGFPLPKDADVLGKALGHKEDNVLEQALTGLLELINEGAFKGNPTLLKTRVKNVALLSGSSSVRERCNDLMAKL
ncbi:MAG: hypothetical protein Q8O67_20010 [Deltaproteobacteria bacterium]|nr:hypothetical protein [Deltaproteobacteria bacterium]